MTRGRMRGAATLGLTAGVLALALSGLAGCVSYRPADLPSAPSADPSAADLAAEAVRLNLPLSPAPVDLSGPLTPDQLGLIAVLANPDIRAQRARLGVADAQVFDAGLLPDPQFSFSLDHPVSGPGLVDAVAAGLGLDTSSLYARPLKQRAVARGDLSANDLEARRLAAADASDRARTVERDLQAARFELNATLGLSPAFVIALAAPGARAGAAPDAAGLIEGAYIRRLDLAALRAGYEAQDAALRSALLMQYPRLNLSLNAARDTGAVRTNGLAVSFDLPLWNRNQGGIAVEEATREQLRAEYEARLFAMRSEVAALVGAYAVGLHQRDELAAQVIPLRQTVEAFERAGARGDVALITAETARQALTDKEIALAALDQALAEQWTALELASGTLIR
ncbi:TolC family protein [Brevundimonas sp.]|uniref:TolC family protein n=1 Tax=Brevundimonas sp. TaxID=1871086 RepID=UPI002ED93708